MGSSRLIIAVERPTYPAWLKGLMMSIAVTDKAAIRTAIAIVERLCAVFMTITSDQVFGHRRRGRWPVRMSFSLLVVPNVHEVKPLIARCHLMGVPRRGKHDRNTWKEVARAGVEPATFRFSGGRSYQLSYLAVEVFSHKTRRLSDGSEQRTRATPTGLEPAASAVTGRRSNQLSYGANV